MIRPTTLVIAIVSISAFKCIAMDSQPQTFAKFLATREAQALMASPSPAIMVITKDKFQYSFSLEKLKELSPVWQEMLQDLEKHAPQPLELGISLQAFSVLVYLMYVTPLEENLSSFETWRRLRSTPFAAEIREEFHQMNITFLTQVDQLTKNRSKDEKKEKQGKILINYKKNPTKKNFAIIYRHLISLKDQERLEFRNFLLERGFDKELLLEPKKIAKVHDKHIIENLAFILFYRNEMSPGEQVKLRLKHLGIVTPLKSENIFSRSFWGGEFFIAHKDLPLDLGEQKNAYLLKEILNILISMELKPEIKEYYYSHHWELILSLSGKQR